MNYRKYCNYKILDSFFYRFKKCFLKSKINIIDFIYFKCFFKRFNISYNSIKKDFLIIMNDLKKDLEFYLKSDPSIENIEDVVLFNPGFFSIMVYRLSHFLNNYSRRFSIFLSEYSHYKVGIDINSKASIGVPFFIDHGTGVVIGETSIIGKKVKIYQGVTLGTRNLIEGNRLKGIKRHPTICDNVTLYADCIVLGGDTIVKENSIIGAKCIITKSVNSNSVIKSSFNSFLKHQ